MLARKMRLRCNGVEVGTTPMIVPAFSSRANIPIVKALEIMSETITGSILISAYDVKWAPKGFPPITFPDLIFLDSGGYEVLKDQEVSAIGFYQPESKDWNREMHLKVLKEWPKDIPTVLISFDLPLERKSTEEQIEDVKVLFNEFHETDNILKEILIKPETIRRKRIHLKDITKNIDSLTTFDILGFTEKELGKSIFDRMTTIAKIRVELDRHGIQIPIHIFGSLDTVTTPLYYFSGADIFDGLAWLRFVFHEGETLYIDSFGPKLRGMQTIRTDLDSLYMTTIALNYTYMLSLKEDLEKFQSTGKFDCFENNSKFFYDANEKLKAIVPEVK